MFFLPKPFDSEQLGTIVIYPISAYAEGCFCSLVPRSHQSRRARRTSSLV
jgi:hypothetical protein